MGRLYKSSSLSKATLEGSPNDLACSRKRSLGSVRGAARKGGPYREGIIYPSLASSARSAGRALRPRAPRFEGGSFDVHKCLSY